jgi:hypothetical protein
MEKFLSESQLTDILTSDKAPALTSDLDVQHMSIMAESQAKYVAEEVQSASADVAGFTNILVPAMRKIMPALFAKELVSIQPMSAPTGFVYAQRFYYKGSKTTPVDVAVAKILTFTGATAVAVGNTITSSAGAVGVVKYVETGKAIIEVTSGTFAVADKFDVGATYSAGANDLTISGVYSAQSAFKQILKSYSGSYSTADGEVLGNAMNQVGFKIDKITVTAKTRKLKSEYTVELVQDLQAQHGQNAETELLNLIEFELMADIDQELLGMVRVNAVAMPDVVVNSVVGTTEASKFQGIYTQVINACEAIVHDTKRGAGNVVVASPKVIAALSLTGKLKGVAADLSNNVTSGAGVGVSLVGTLDNGAKVYRNAFATSNEVIVAYKGASAADAGVFYCPYIPLMVQKATNPDTLQPIIAMMTRYGVVETPLVEEVGVNPYFRVFTVDFASTTLA